MRALLFAAALLTAASAAQAQGADAIRLNQIGFYPDAPKTAVVTSPAAGGAFSVRPAAGGAAVLSGTLGAARTWTASGETIRRADLSALTVPGTYVLEVDGVGASHPFAVRAGVHAGLARAALKGFYFQRASTPLPAVFAGLWARAAGHPDTAVRVHASAATAARPAGTLLSAPRGWYDAGDYNKYVVNSGISVAMLLALVEWFPDAAAGLDVGIPESGNGVPDVLDEALWNIRWMATMQDPADGGVYHKLTHASFAGEVMPVAATAPRYVVQKGTAATLDFAATMAQASRVAARFPDALPGLADSLRDAALDAWHWARANPAVRYNQAALNAAFDPDIVTGEYGDASFGDEFDWAAMELFLTTDADSFLTIRQPLQNPAVGLPWWGGVRDLGYYSLLANRQRVAARIDTTALRNALLGTAGALVSRSAASAYGVPMGTESWHWGWGSNSVAANQGVLLMMAHALTGDDAYLHAATDALDYLLGRNATGYSFVTGHGSRPPLNPHHRPSRADGVGPPVPGLLVGGPNPGREDGCTTYPSTLPARSYTDTWCSYASNEIAINWNAPLVFLAVAVEAAHGGGVVRTEDAPETGALRLRVLPNPTAGDVAVRFTLDAPGAATLRLVDALGREVARVEPGLLAAGEQHVALATAHLPAGRYTVQVATAAAAATGSVVVVR